MDNSGEFCNMFCDVGLGGLLSLLLDPCASKSWVQLEGVNCASESWVQLEGVNCKLSGP